MSTALTASGAVRPAATGRPVTSPAGALNADPPAEAPATSTRAMGAVGPPAVTTVASPPAAPTASSVPDPETEAETPPETETPLPASPAPSPQPTLPTPATEPPVATSALLPASTPSLTPAPQTPFSIPIIVGIAVGGAVLLAAVAGICWWCGRTRRRSAQRHMEDDALGSFKPPRNRRTRRPSRGGYSRHGEHAPPPPLLQPPRAGLSRAEARASVQLFNQPPRAFDAATTRSSAWSDSSEMDVFAVDGSSYARTLSTMSRPNSEYHLEEDEPGSVGYGTPFNSPFPTYQGGPVHGPGPMALQAQALQKHQEQLRHIQTPSPAGYPPQPAVYTSPSGTFGRTTPTGTGTWAEPVVHTYASGPHAHPHPHAAPLPQHPQQPQHPQHVPHAQHAHHHAPPPSPHIPPPAAHHHDPLHAHALSPAAHHHDPLHAHAHAHRPLSPPAHTTIPVVGLMAPAPSHAPSPGPSRRPDGRLPAPKLLVDTKAPFDANGIPLSTLHTPLSALPTPISANTWAASPLPTPLDRAPSRSRTLSPESTFVPPSRSTSRGAAFAPSPGPGPGPSSMYAGPSTSYGAPRALVSRQGSRSDDRPSALPYAGASPSSSVPGSAAASSSALVYADVRTAEPKDLGPGLKRGPTIIRHADAGAFADAVPDDEGEVHLPPAYDEIYAPNP